MNTFGRVAGACKVPGIQRQASLFSVRPRRPSKESNRDSCCLKSPQRIKLIATHDKASWLPKFCNRKSTELCFEIIPIQDDVSINVIQCAIPLLCPPVCLQYLRASPKQCYPCFIETQAHFMKLIRNRLCRRVSPCFTCCIVLAAMIIG